MYMRWSLFPALLLAVNLTACDDTSPQNARVPASPAAAGPLHCEDLKTLTLAGTTVSGAGIVAAGAFTPPVPDFPPSMADYTRLPAFCRVTGSLKPSTDSDIRFEVWLPEENWNGKFMQTGNGGAAGSIIYWSLANSLARGYAVANTDTGHRGGGGDFAWAAGHPQQLIDFQYRSFHELTLVGKAITEARYGKAPAKSYWNGCSTGGRQGLKEAQRFPGDYDGIIAGAPASNWTGLVSLSVLIQQNLGPARLGLDKLNLLKEAAIAACDARDGVKDRVISEPGKCDFDPASLQCKNGAGGQCLTAKEVAAARRIYAGVADSNGRVFMPGTGIGSEPVWAFYASPTFGIGTSYYRYVVMKDPNWDPATFNMDTDPARAEQVDGGVTNAMDPDLSAFIQHGGKLITYHGATDGLIPYRNSVNYYRSVAGKLGADAIKDSVKFYLVPGMDHCAGGDGAFVIDWLTALEDWVEQGRTPGALHAAHPAVMPGPPGAPPVHGKAFTRPACVYPQVAKYTGNGDDTDAANFECVAP